MTRSRARILDVKPTAMLVAQPKKRKRPVDDSKVVHEPVKKKHKIEMYGNSRPIVESSKAVAIPSESCGACGACGVVARREHDGPLEMPLQKPNFILKEIIWAKIKGFPGWPAQIIDFPSQKMVIVKWFNDGRITKIYRTQMFKFLINYDKFAVNFDDAIGLKTAAREALYEFSDSLQSKS